MKMRNASLQSLVQKALPESAVFMRYAPFVLNKGAYCPDYEIRG